MKGRYLSVMFATLSFAAFLVWVLWPLPPKSKCGGGISGRLEIDHVHQENSAFCWVATVSELLKWRSLSNSDQCHLYDLWHGKNVCRDKHDNPCDGRKNCWVAMPGNNMSGAPEDAASKYKDTYGAITVSTRQSPSYDADSTAQPLSFEEIRDMICPENGGLGKPFIWAYVKEAEVLSDGTVVEFLHDRVVFGYAFIPYETPRLLFAYDPNSFPGEVSLAPYTYEYDEYGDISTWREDVIISDSFIQTIKWRILEFIRGKLWGA